VASAFYLYFDLYIFYTITFTSNCILAFNMNSLERDFNVAVSAAKIPGTILAAANTDGISHPLYWFISKRFLLTAYTGSFEYLKPFGNSSLEKDSLPVSLSSTMCLASCTKLVTCVATMQCVERGLVGLDDEISTRLHEWKDALILKGFEGDNEQKPVLEKAKNPILLKFVWWSGMAQG
jgi:hypothetical protein